MTIAFEIAGASDSGTSTIASFTRTGTLGDLIVIAIAIEGQAAGSGPWIIPNTGQLTDDYIGSHTGWKLVCYEPPSASGVGLEVWAAISGTTSGTSHASLTSSLSFVAIQLYYSGIYAPTSSINDGAVRAATVAQVTGNTPAAPSVYAFASELVIAVGGEQMSSPGFGAPSGYTSRVDATRGGYGNAEATMADALVLTEGDTGAITFPGNGASGSSKGATATLAIRPATTTAAATSPVIHAEYAVT